MRADRLLSLLMLLQTRGKMTAAALASELEVSERTIYRDMEALGMAGMPVVAERGPGGGCGLLEGWRSDLTGLTANEAAALAALDIPAPLAQLGIGASLRQALLKVVAAHSAPASAGRPGARLYLDPEPWGRQAQPAVPLLADVYRAVNAGRRLRVARNGPRGEPLWLELDPYGLVSKEGRWYLLAGSNEHMVVFRVDHLLAAEPLGAPVDVPAAFDLKARWESAWRTLAAEQQPYWVRLRAHVSLLGELRRQFPGQHAELDQAMATQTDGWLTIPLPFGSLEAARARILPWGGAAVVLAPEPLRQSVADYARQAARRYEGETPEGASQSAPAQVGVL